MIRDACAADSPALSRLLGQLGHPTAADVVRERLRVLEMSGDRALVAVRDDTVIGLLTLHRTPSLHREPDGRISSLVVADDARGLGVGSALVRAAEEICRAGGCGRMEVMSSIDRVDAHRFYEQHGYRESRKRFRKSLERP